MTIYEADFPVPAVLTAPGGCYEIEQRRFRGRDYPMFKHAPRTLGALLGEALVRLRCRADERMTEQDGVVTTFGEFERGSAALSLFLQEAMAVRPGKHVAVVMANRVEWMMSFFAILAAGAVPVLVNSRGAGPEILRAVNMTDCVAAICDQERHALLVGDAGWPGPVVLLGESASGTHDFAQAAAARPGLMLKFAARDPEAAAFIMFSSGTTGFPKAIVHSQGGAAHALTMGMLAIEAFDFLYEAEFGVPPARGLPKKFPPNIISSPMFHGGGVVPYLRSIITGQATIIVTRWNADTVFDIMEREGVSRLSLVPTMIFDMLASPRAQGGVMSQLRYLANGTAALSPKVAAAFREALPNCLMLNTYAQSESLERVTTFGGREFEQNLAAVGRVAPTIRLRILRDDRSDADPGEPGEIAVLGAMTMSGYYNDPEATAEAICDGWLLTGDIGRFDEKGLLHIVDRKKNMVICGGENIYCAEVERVLNEHPAVAESIAFGEPHGRLGERLVAVAVLKPGMDANEDELKAYAKANLAIYKVPRAIAFSNDPLPRNATGKVAKGVFLAGFDRPWVVEMPG